MNKFFAQLKRNLVTQCVPASLGMVIGLGMLGWSVNAQAAPKPTLNVLTYDVMDSYGVAKALTPDFEKQCGCIIKWTFANQQVQLQPNFLLNYKKQAYDVVLGMNQQQANEALTKYSKYFIPVQVDFKKLNNVGFDATRNKYALPVSWSPLAIAYNSITTKLTPTTFKSFKDWVESDKTSFIFADPRTNDLGAHLNRLVAYYYPTAAQQEAAWQKIKAKTVTVGKGWSSSYGVFVKGEAHSAMAYASSQIYHQLVEKRHDIEFLNFSTGVPYLADNLLIAANAPQARLAQQFAQYMLTPAAQKVLFLYNSSYPVVKFPNGSVSAAEQQIANTVTNYKIIDLYNLSDKQLKTAQAAYLKVFSK